MPFAPQAVRQHLRKTLPRLQEHWQRMVHLGWRDHLSPREQSRITLSNRLALITLPLTLILLLLSLRFGRLEASLISLGMNLVLGFSLWANHKGLFLLGRWMLITAFIVMITALVITYGRASGGYMTYLALGIGVVLFFEGWLHRGLLLGLIILGFSISEFSLYTYGPYLPEQVSTATYPVTFLMNFVSLVVLMHFFSSEEKRHAQESKALLEEAEHRRQEALSVKNDLEQFATAASHHMNTPIRNVNSFLRLIKKDLPDDASDQLKEFLWHAQENIESLSRLLFDLYQFSQIAQAQSSHTSIETSLSTIIGDLVQHRQDHFPNLNGEIRYTKLTEVPIPPTHTKTLFRHLIANALTYNNSPHPWVEISAEKTFEGIHIWLTDNGIGIPDAYREEVFNLFTRLHTGDAYPGTGLGLAICLRIARLYEGNITIEESSPSGTRFRIFFPHKQAAADLPGSRPKGWAKSYRKAI